MGALELRINPPKKQLAKGLQNSDVQAQRCGCQAFTHLEVDAGGSAFAIPLSVILSNIF